MLHPSTDKGGSAVDPDRVEDVGFSVRKNVPTLLRKVRAELSGAHRRKWNLGVMEYYGYLREVSSENVMICTFDLTFHHCKLVTADSLLFFTSTAPVESKYVYRYKFLKVS